MAKENGSGRLLTVGEVATRLQCGERTVLKRIHSGKMPAVREGGRFLVDEADLSDYISRRKYKPRRRRR